jgi:hypothetical protein
MSHNPYDFLNFNQTSDNKYNEDSNDCQTNQPPEILLDEFRESHINPITGEEIVTKTIIESNTFDGRTIKRIINKPYISENEVIDPNEIGAFNNTGAAISKKALIKCTDCRKVLDSRNEEAHKINKDIWLCEKCNKVNSWRKIITLFSLTLIRLPYYD